MWRSCIYSFPGGQDILCDETVTALVNATTPAAARHPGELLSTLQKNLPSSKYPGGKSENISQICVYHCEWKIPQKWMIRLNVQFYLKSHLAEPPFFMNRNLSHLLHIKTKKYNLKLNNWINKKSNELQIGMGCINMPWAQLTLASVS